MAKNFSTYFYIYNNTGFNLIFAGDELGDHTKWEISPPTTIAPTTVAPTAATAQAKNTRDLEGSGADMVYFINYENGSQAYVDFDGEDPYSGSNGADSTLYQKVDEQQDVSTVNMFSWGSFVLPDIVVPVVLEITAQYYSGGGTPSWSWKLPKSGHPFSVLFTLSVVDENINWMSTGRTVNNQSLLSQPLKNICLPATHDSGTYALTNQLAPELYDLPSWLPLIYRPNGGYAKIDSLPAWMQAILNLIPGPGLLSPAVQAIVNEVVYGTMLDWGTATTRTIRQQLGDGIRRLDIRVCLTEQGEFRIFHTLTGPLISDILADMQSFAASSTSEFVIVYFSHITSGHKKGLTEAQHQQLLNMIAQTLAGNLLPNSVSLSPQSTLQELVTPPGGTARTTFLIVYQANSSDTTGPIPSGIWTTDNNIWINKPDPSTAITTAAELHAYELEQINNDMSNVNLYPLNSVLTPDNDLVTTDVKNRILHQPTLSLQTWEAPLYNSLHDFVQSLTSSQLSRVNCITTDFEEYTDVVGLAIAISSGQPII